MACQPLWGWGKDVRGRTKRDGVALFGESKWGQSKFLRPFLRG